MLIWSDPKGKAQSCHEPQGTWMCSLSTSRGIAARKIEKWRCGIINLLIKSHNVISAWMALLSSNHTANIQWKIREADPGIGNEKFQKRFFLKGFSSRGQQGWRNYWKTWKEGENLGIVWRKGGWGVNSAPSNSGIFSAPSLEVFQMFLDNSLGLI